MSIDPNIPALPLKLNREQQQKLCQAPLRGDPAAEDVMQALTRQVLLA